MQSSQATTPSYNYSIASLPKLEPSLNFISSVKRSDWVSKFSSHSTELEDIINKHRIYIGSYFWFSLSRIFKFLGTLLPHMLEIVIYIQPPSAVRPHPTCVCFDCRFDSLRQSILIFAQSTAYTHKMYLLRPD
jgi:hypothetical protein